jgi:hypothetical protein
MVWGKRLPSLSFRAHIHDAKGKSVLKPMYGYESLTHRKGCFYRLRSHVSLQICSFLEQWSFGFDIHGGAHIDVMVVANREKMQASNTSLSQ